eukprot:TRINITY_DN59609_c0_g2_i3.p1 TRINITY_DN59609_c0_g2~~TRINITY_DN59609_c0_g2_i3.p1  ORF type:complete len:437 (-),score=72.21 TRINITY_DN59609_c0_g2_i3:149-1459(-)
MALRFRSTKSEPKVAIPEEDAEDVTGPAILSWPETVGRAACQDVSETAQQGPPATVTLVQADYFTALNWGGRHDNEDRPVVAQDMIMERSMPFSMVGVLDGHDTAEASHMVAKALPSALAPKLKEGCSVPDAYRSAMEDLEEMLKKHSPHPSAGTCVLNCLIAGRHVWCSNLGDCRAVLVFLKPVDPMAKPNGGLRARQTSAERNRDDKQSAGGAVVEKPEETGNPTLCGRLAGRRLSGSSVRASSKTDKRPSGSVPAPPKAQPMRLSWLSRDHKASCPHEKERIREAGGMVIDGRVEGLEPSRTLGDFDVKLQVRKNVISIVPEVRRQAIGDGIEPSQAVLVCATDGVWDILSGQDVCNIIGARKELGVLQSAALAEGLAGEQAAGCFVTPELRLHMKELAEDLVQFSIAKGSRDDCTAVCALVTAVPRCCIPRG